MVSCIPIKSESFSVRSIWSIDETLIGTTTPGQSGPGRNCNDDSALPRTPEIKY